MAPLLPLVVTLALSMAGPVAAIAYDDDAETSTPYRAYGYNPSYGSFSGGNLEPQRDTWRREAFEADQRNQAAVERRNQPPAYDPTPTNPNAPFGVWSGNSYQVCQKGFQTVYCF
jgi:hypothetical protein